MSIGRNGGSGEQAPAIEVTRAAQDVRRWCRGRRRHRLHGASRGGVRLCSVRTAPASRRRSGCSRPRSRRPAGPPASPGFDVVDDPIDARRASAVVFQEAVVDGSLTGRRNLEIHARLWGVPKASAETTIADIVERFGLSDLLDRTVATYSGGQRRRLEIARSLRVRPERAVPRRTDRRPRSAHPLRAPRPHRDLRANNAMTIVLTTHYLDEAERLCDRIAIVHAGEIVALDTPAALLDSLGPEILELRVGADVDALLSFLRGARPRGRRRVRSRQRRSPFRCAARSARRGHRQRRGVRRARSLATTTRPPSLDDVYLRLTGTRLAA